MKEFFRYLRHQWLFRVVRVAFAVGIAFSICQLDLAYLESWAYDLRVRLSPKKKTSGHIQTIEVNANDVEFLQGEPSIAHHLELLRSLIATQPKAILYLLDMNSVNGTEVDKQNFAALAEEFPNLYFSANQLILKGQEEELRMPKPFDKIKTVMALTTSDEDKFAKDGVTRRLIISNSGQPFIHHKLASHFNHIVDTKDYQGSFQYLTSQQALIDFKPAGSFKPYSFISMLTGQYEPSQFKDRIVLIGRNTIAEAEDYRQTPFSREITAMSNLEVHANTIDTLIQNSSPWKTSKIVDIIITILISILTVFSVFTLRPSTGLIILSSALSLFLISVYGIYISTGLIIDVAHPLFAIFVCYYFFIPYRLIMENRKSWEYLQHNKLLTEVEELKTNFLRMMSHDLKTPLARIQGMTDIALRDVTPLSHIQTDAIKNISKSSNELTVFIESILNLSRIESNEVKLQLKSRDINSILSNIIEQCQFLAKDKNINIIEDFEPMFSIRLDEALLKQVFTNLVENAIKYSPEGSNIMISTEEVNGHISVQVSDQGFGIGESELPHVFDKFFRSQEAKTSPIKGHGLGLYLTRYFVELHSGKISVDSQLNMGSTFTVEIPIDLEI